MLTMADCIRYTRSVRAEDKIAGPYIYSYGEDGCLGVQVLRYCYPERDVHFVVSHYEIDGEVYDIPEDIHELCGIWYNHFCGIQSVYTPLYTKEQWLAFLACHTEELGDACREYLDACREP